MKAPKTTKTFSPVFTYASIIVGILVLIGAIFPNQFGKISGTLGAWITETFGWYYMLVFTLVLAFCIFLVFSPIGKLKLGKRIQVCRLVCRVLIYL